MDPDRVHSYLKIACAGLGFDIGEVWVTSHDMSSSTTLPTLGEDGQNESENDEFTKNHSHDQLMFPSNTYNARRRTRKIRFIQLYTSKNYDKRRSDLLQPSTSLEIQVIDRNRNANIQEDLKQHVLSPRLVNVIADTAQVVWSNCEKREGLLGRSDMRLQTAVGMPVARDADGNMCIVVMFSPNNIPSSAEAIEYLKFISTCATSTSIPCLLPVISNRSNNTALAYSHSDNFPSSLSTMDTSHSRSLTSSESSHDLSEFLDKSIDDMGSGITTQFVPMDENVSVGDSYIIQKVPLGGIIDLHDDRSIPKSSFMESDGSALEHSSTVAQSIENLVMGDVFDDASYGLWTTIMNIPTDDFSLNRIEDSTAVISSRTEFTSSDPITVRQSVQALEVQVLDPQRKERLEEFASAFLGMSVFDVADVWIPASHSYGVVDSLLHSFTLLVTDANEGLNLLKHVSLGCTVSPWCGAVGRAFWSGKPVWSTTKEIFIDVLRAEAFELAAITTTVAVPIFSEGAVMPSCVFCCYSLLHVDAVPFVLSFIQRALRLLWVGLDHIEPHESIGRTLWKDVAPADLGEMAADTEMQYAFIAKKRPHQDIAFIEERTTSCSEDVSTSSFVEYDYQSPFVPIDTIQNFIKDAVISLGNIAQTYPFEGIPCVDTHDLNIASLLTGHSNLVTPHEVSVHAITKNSKRSRKQLDDGISKSTERSIPVQLFQTALPDLSQAHELKVKETHLSPTKKYTSLPQRTQLQFLPHVSPLGSIPNSTAASGLVLPESEATLCLPVSQCTSEEHRIIHKTSSDATHIINCRIPGCPDQIIPRKPYCGRHCGNRLCEYPGCSKCAQGVTRFCISHGGGRRCTHPGCDKGARDKYFCAGHGGGKRCSIQGCKKSAVGGTKLCTSHGGGRRCEIDGCFKSAQSSTPFCVKHGGGRKCANDSCEKVARGRTLYCAAHGGGVRCKLEGCSRVAIGKFQLCRAHGGKSRNTFPD